MKYARTVLDLIGNTPLVRLNHVTEGVQATVLAKLEYLNPGGSVKDRIAEPMLEAATREGHLPDGGTIVEPTAGNTGVALAIAAGQRGQACTFVVPDKVSVDKRAALEAYGARVVLTPTAVPAQSPESLFSVSDTLAAQIPGGYKPDQFSNPLGPQSHYETTGPEIWRDTDGRITHFVAGVGTGGTITGAGRYLREVSANRGAGEVRIIGADPEGSLYSGSVHPYFLEGVGEDMWPTTYDPSVPHELMTVTDAESFAMARRLARQEGLLVGGSSGMAVTAALRVAQELGPQDVLVVLLPDSGRGYLSTIFDDAWMGRHGFIEPEGPESIGNLCGSARFVSLHCDSRVGDALELLSTCQRGVLPIVSTHHTHHITQVLGTLESRDLAHRLACGRATKADAVTEHMGLPLPLVGRHETLAQASMRLADAPALLVTAAGSIQALVTAEDILHYLKDWEQ